MEVALELTQEDVNELEAQLVELPFKYSQPILKFLSTKFSNFQQAKAIRAAKVEEEKNKTQTENV